MLTSAYLTDRMTMLIRKNWFNIEDKNPLDSTITFSSSNHSFQNINDYFEDKASGYTISQGELSGKTPRYFFGGESSDHPAASAVEDHLYGGGGDDVLKGLEGNDYLEGGTGSDTYVINPGGGTDTVLDTDGIGAIQFGTVIAQGRSGVTDSKDWIKTGNTWIDQKNDLVYLLAVQENGASDLFVSFVGSSNSARVRIKNWSDGKLGITLGDNTPADAPVLDRIIVGDLKPEKPLDYDELGNIAVGTEEEADREDFLYGSAGNDHIRSLGGNDEVDGKDGKDRIEGGSGDDVLAGGAENDIVLGGTGNDIIQGQLHDDRLYAETEHTLDAAYTLSTTQAGTGKRGDLLDGNMGNDTLIGDTGNDILMGGHGNDVLLGLGGNDTIEGDLNVESFDRDWKVNRTTGTRNNVTTYFREYSFGSSPTEAAAAAGGDDAITSGTGSDWVFAGGGNDFVDAGADNDLIFGDAGNDTLLGQDGDDVMQGDNHHSRLAVSLHGNDHLSGGNGNDQLTGAGGSDYLDGGAGSDTLIGDDQGIPMQYQDGDYLDGGSGDDLLLGGGGNDTLTGGAGNDALYGGAGDDIYIDVETGDFIGDLAGQNIILLAETGSAGLANSITGPGNPSQGAPANTGPSSSNRPASVAWSSDISTLHLVAGSGGTLDLQDALYGMQAQIQFDHGSDAIDLETWVSENLHDPVVLNLSMFENSSEQSVVQAYGGTAADLIQGSVNNDTLRGHGGDDHLLGRSGDDRIAGGAGNDALFGQTGNDTLWGGAGADQYTGGSGADIYLFNRGDNADMLTATAPGDASDDIVQLGAGIVVGDLRFFKLADGGLLMRIEGTQDSLLFQNWHTQGPNIAALQFSDHSYITASEMETLATAVLGGTPGDDILTGTASDDRIEGYAGNDILSGNAGNDLLIGGDDHDIYLFGWASAGDDAVVESSGSISTIALTGDTLLADLRHEHTGNDLILSLRGGGTTLTLKDYFASQQSWMIRTENNMVIEMAGWLSRQEPAIDIAQLQKDFVDAVRGQWANDLRSDTSDRYYGLYTRIDETAYRANLVSAYESNVIVQHLTMITNFADSATIRRQSTDSDSATATIDLIAASSPETPEEPPAGQQFISIVEWNQRFKNFQLPLGVTSINNMSPVYDNEILIGFITDNRQSTTLGSFQQFQQTTITVDTYIEQIQGGDSDNVIEGFKGGNQYQSNYTSGTSDVTRGSEISLIDGGGGNDILYASGKIRLNDEMFYLTDSAPNIGGFLYGNNGNDTLYGNYARDTLAGGNDSDFLDGRFSADRYIVFAEESGIDTIWDTGTQLWQIESTNGDYIASYIYLNERLDPLPIAQDTLQLIGIHPNDVRFSWGQRVAEGIRDSWQGTADEFAEAMHSQTMHTTLILSWTSGGVEIILPNSTDLPGMGLEHIQFGDGTALSLPELITLIGPAPVSLNPQNMDNAITGTSSDEVIYGENGNDTLNGGGGNDVLNGGTGDDTLTGEAGNDTYLFSKNSGRDTINNYDVTPDKIDTILFGHGITSDEVRISRSGNHLILTIVSTGDMLIIQNYLENDGITPFAVEQIKFNDSDDIWDLASIKAKLASDNQAPRLLSAIPDRSMLEGIAFSYSIDTGAFHDPDGDKLTYSATLADGAPLPPWLSFTPLTNILSGLPDMPGSIDVRITATDPDALAVSDTFTIFISAQNLTLNGTSGPDSLNGASGNDKLSGLAGNDVLNGFAGNDRLNGGKGIDTMAGDTGNDIYWIDNSGDSIVEQFLEGIDAARSSISFALSSNVEHLTLTGNGAITATGNELDNELTGNNADNILIGNAGNDRLNGRGGADVMNGGIGDDIYIVNNAGDSVNENLNEGYDTVIASIAYTLGDHVENLTLSGTAADMGTGNLAANIITGNKAANVIWGRAGDDILSGDGGADTLYGENGNDLLDGGAGKDTLEGGAGNDTYRFGRGYGKDTLIENDTAANIDRITFLPAIDPDQLWFRRTGSNLEISVIGTNDKLIIKDWYLSPAHHIEQFVTADGSILENDQVEHWVTAMADLALPAIGQTSLPSAYEPILDPLIAAYWL